MQRLTEKLFMSCDFPPQLRPTGSFFGFINIFLCVLVAIHRWVNRGHQSKCVCVLLTLSLGGVWKGPPGAERECPATVWRLGPTRRAQQLTWCGSPFDSRWQGFHQPRHFEWTRFKQRYFNQPFMNLNMSSGSLRATSTPCPPPVPHTRSVPRGLLWMGGSWINTEALTPVSFLRRASHQRQRSRWKNLWSFCDIQLWGGSDMMPHRGTGGEVWETIRLSRFTLSLIKHKNVIKFTVQQ